MLIRRLKLTDIALLQGILIYTITAIILFPHFQYQLNPDGVSYMGIAQKYLAHDFANAVNGYWGPLISWLMVPFLAVGFGPLVSANVLLILIGFLVVIMSDSIIKKIEINPWLHFLIIDIISFIVVFFVYRAITPDLLFVLMSLVLIYQMLNESPCKSEFAGIALGLTGAGLYFTKNFGFPFFITTFSAYCLAFFLRPDKIIVRRRIISNFITGMLVFLIMSGIWIVLISSKYDKLVIGTAGFYTRAIFEQNSMGHPMFYAGLLDPPNNTATSIWEDVSSLNLNSYNIFDSFEKVIIEMRATISRMVRVLPGYLTDISIISIPLLFIIIIYLIKKGKEMLKDGLFCLTLIMIILFTGYSMIAIDPRFIWLSEILLIISGAKLMGLLFDKIKIKKPLKIVLIVFFAASFLFTPMKLIYYSKDNGNYLPVLSAKLKSLNINGRIASIGDWETSMYLSFYNGWQYFGSSGDYDEVYLENELISKKINYYFVWEPIEKKMDFLTKYTEITNGNLINLKIYKLN